MTLEHINSQSRAVSSLAQRILSWVTFAFRPLTIAALQTAMAIDPDDDEFDQDKVIPESALVSSCAGLIAVDQRHRMYTYSVSPQNCKCPRLA
jgi:hypothetical protein